MAQAKIKPKTTAPPRLIRLIGTPQFARRYMVYALLVLFVTTLFWSLLGAHLQSGNADQLVNSYLFANAATFRGAVLPATHSFLLKWPVFWLIKLFAFSSAAYTIFTVLLVLITVAALVVVLQRLEHRPLIFGTLCLALASVLLMVPVQPYAGGILPVNMAMIATRNIEYVYYLAALILLVQSAKIRSRRFWLGVAILAVLIASDRLFLSLSLGGALLALVTYALIHGWRLVSLAVRWLVAGLLAAAMAVIGLGLLNGAHLTHFMAQTSASPYSLAHSSHDLALGLFYAVMGLATNFGANPAFDATVVRQVPAALQARLLSVGGPAYLVNLAVLVLLILMAYRLLRSTLSRQKAAHSQNQSSTLALLLIWSGLAAVLIFVASNHYYAVDARYLTLTVFALFVSAAAYTRRRSWPSLPLLTVGSIISLGIVFGLFGSWRVYAQQRQAMVDVNRRNHTLVSILANHPVQTLVGDYWRVLPTKFDSPNSQPIMPLGDCTQARQVLTSRQWQPSLKKHSFAYLLSIDKGLTDYPSCSLKQAIDAYGRPNASAVIAGSLSQPKELILFYDHGVNKSTPSLGAKTAEAATVLPIAPEELPDSSCSTATIMNVVAHQDDDLLFMSPDVLHDIQSGHCVRTIYMTAGDDGSDRFYWLGRERGSEAAYASMLGTNQIWIERIVQLANKQFVTVASPRNNPRISLIFMHLPDGNLKGDGFAATHRESLSHLESGKLTTIHAVDGQSSYNSDQIINALTTFMHLYNPAEIRTQSSLLSQVYPDHSDHMVVGRYTQAARQRYESQQYEDRVTIPIVYYIGYPIHAMRPNVSGSDLQRKAAAFFSYAKYDPAVCHSLEDCAHNAVYGAYLTRQYANTY